MNNLDDIELSATAIANLYRHALVLGEEQSSEGKPAAYNFLGNNLKKIVLLVNSPGAYYIPDSDLLFLTKMLEACKLNLGDIAIVNHGANAVHIGPLLLQLQPRIVLLFGVEPTTIQLPFTIPVFKIQQYNDCTYLYAPGPGMLNQDNDEGKLLKSKLWVCLRKLFDL